MTDRRTHAWRGLILGQALALAFLAACAAWVWREIKYVLPNYPVTASFSLEDAMRSPLGLQLAAFLAALVICHALLGLASFGLARLTRAAFPKAAGESLLTAAWFLVLVGLVLTANTTWFASSQFAAAESWWREPIGGFHPVQILAVVVTSVIALLAWHAARRMPPMRVRSGAAAGGTALVLAAAIGLPQLLEASSPAPAGAPPHVVLVGIDSLRNDLEIPRLGAAAVPNIREFLESAHRFDDATSPLARTYPAWVSILTGRHPVSTNARFNLMPRHLVQAGDTLPGTLAAAGYRTVYATDEVRFANFDESFGFQQLITPPAGAIDFLLGYAGDMPVVNLVAATAIGRWLFPANHANRAAHVTYEPEQFVARLQKEIRIDGPVLLVIHLTLAHWPYAWAGQPVPRQPNAYREAYGRAIATVDTQFAEVMAMLEGKGVLDNAVVVLLSDHGEALGADTDSMIRGTGTPEEIWNTLWGHGTSALSPHQYSVLLAMRAYGRAVLPGTPAAHDWPVSLEDLRPTLEQLITGRAPRDVDGLSLLPYLLGTESPAAMADRIRFTETDFNTPSVLAGRYEAHEVAAEAAGYYEVDPKSGWVQLRAQRLPGLVERKQRAAISGETLLVAVPDAAGQGQRYLVTSRHDPMPRPLAARPEPDREPEAARLWDALQGRFPGELPALPGSP